MHIYLSLMLNQLYQIIIHTRGSICHEVLILAAWVLEDDGVVVLQYGIKGFL